MWINSSFCKVNIFLSFFTFMWDIFITFFHFFLWVIDFLFTFVYLFHLPLPLPTAVFYYWCASCDTAVLTSEKMMRPCAEIWLPALKDKEKLLELCINYKLTKLEKKLMKTSWKTCKKNRNVRGIELSFYKVFCVGWSVCVLICCNLRPLERKKEFVRKKRQK